MPAFQLNLFILGVVGGALPDVIRIIKMKDQESLPNYLKKVNFWLGLFLLVLLGGLAAWLLGAQDPKTAIGMGFAAPEAFSRLAAKTEDPDRGDGLQFNLRDWWAN
jgi:hypothetical protein